MGALTFLMQWIDCLRARADAQMYRALWSAVQVPHPVPHTLARITYMQSLLVRTLQTCSVESPLPSVAPLVRAITSGSFVHAGGGVMLPIDTFLRLPSHHWVPASAWTAFGATTYRRRDCDFHVLTNSFVSILDSILSMYDHAPPSDKLAFLTRAGLSETSFVQILSIFVPRATTTHHTAAAADMAAMHGAALEAAVVAATALEAASTSAL